MNKKGQAAMEFLMTYGWAILVVLAAIAALAYFGVLDPGNLVPERTTFTAPLASVDTAEVSLADNSFEIAFRNNVGVAITLPLTGTITEAIGTECNNPVLTGNLTDGTAIAAGTTVIPNGEGFRLTWDCDASSLSPKANSKFKLDAVTFDYTNQETGQTKTQSGTIQGKYK